MSSLSANSPASDVTASRTATVKEDAADVAGTAKQGVSEVAQEAGAQAREVAGKAKDQARDLVDQATSEVRSRASEQAERAAAGLEQLTSRVQALVAGRPEDAGPLREYAVQLGERTQRAAEQLRARGVDGVLDDVRSFARRRPGAFLAGAAAAGFMVGRLVKAQRANSSDSSPASGSEPSSWNDPAGRVPGGEAPVYGTVPAATEIPAVQPYPTPGLEEYPAGVVGAVGSVELEARS
jgi:hypothetical protein